MGVSGPGTLARIPAFHCWDVCASGLHHVFYFQSFRSQSCFSICWLPCPCHAPAMPLPCGTEQALASCQSQAGVGCSVFAESVWHGRTSGDNSRGKGSLYSHKRKGHRCHTGPHGEAPGLVKRPRRMGLGQSVLWFPREGVGRQGE